MITLKLKKINKNHNESIKDLETIINLPSLICPCCNSMQIIKYGFYKRFFIFLINGIVCYEQIKIQRVKCKSCGRTHALLPTFIIPYKQYSLDLISVILLKLETETYEKVSNRYNINVRYLANFKKKYVTKHKPRCQTAFNNLTFTQILNKFIEGSNIIEQYIKINNFNFMQDKILPIMVCDF